MLTENAVQRIYTSGQIDGEPVLQVVAVKETEGKDNAGSPRYRLVLSDGAHFINAMVSQNTGGDAWTMIQQQQIPEHSIIKIKRAVVQCIKPANRLVVLPSEIELVEAASSMIGQPQSVEKAGFVMGTVPEPSTAIDSKSSTVSAPSPAKHKAVHTAPHTATNTQQYHPISSLNPYYRNWSIKARVTAKGDLREYNNKKTNAPGHLLNVDLLDAQGGEIRATMFNEAALKFNNVLQKDKVYVISKGSVRLANKRFTSVNNEYELQLDANSEITPVEDDRSIEAVHYALRSIEGLATESTGEVVDVLGVVTKVSPLQSITAKSSGKTVNKRTLTLADQSLQSIDLAIWGDQAAEFDEVALGSSPILVAKGCKINEFMGGRTLNTSFSSLLRVNPHDLKEAQALADWWNTTGKSATFDTLSKRLEGGAAGGEGKSMERRVTLATMKEGQLGQGEKGDYVWVRGTVMLVNKNYEKPPWYIACPTKECNNVKLQEDGAGGFKCEKCNKTFTEPNPRFILPLCIKDYSGSQWITAFDQPATKLVGRDAIDIYRIKESQDKQAFENSFNGALFKHLCFKLRVKIEQDNLRCHLISFHEPNFVQESRLLLDEIAKFESS